MRSGVLLPLGSLLVTWAGIGLSSMRVTASPPIVAVVSNRQARVQAGASKRQSRVAALFIVMEHDHHRK